MNYRDPATTSILIAICNPFGGNPPPPCSEIWDDTRVGHKSFALWALALSKNRRANAHQRRAFLDRDNEIVRHPHGKARKFQVEFLFERVTQFAQLHKKGSRGFCFPGERRNYHQTLDRQSRQCEQRFHFRAYGFRFETKFTPLTRHIYFEQDSRMHSVLVRDPVYLLRQRKRI